MLTQRSQSNRSVPLLLPDRLSTGLEKGTLGLFRGLLKNGQQLQCWKRDAEMAFQLQRYHPCAEDTFKAITRPRSHPAAFLLRSNASYLSSGCPMASVRRQSLALLARAWPREEELFCPAATFAAQCLRWLPFCRPGLWPEHWCWSTARAIVLLLFVHHPQDWQLHSYGVIVASFSGNRNKAQCWH